MEEEAIYNFGNSMLLTNLFSFSLLFFIAQRNSSNSYAEKAMSTLLGDSSATASQDRYSHRKGTKLERLQQLD